MRKDVDLRIPVVKKLCENFDENVKTVLTSQKTTSEDYLRVNIDIDNKNADVLCLEDFSITKKVQISQKILI